MYFLVLFLRKEKLSTKIKFYDIVFILNLNILLKLYHMFAYQSIDIYASVKFCNSESLILTI